MGARVIEPSALSQIAWNCGGREGPSVGGTSAQGVCWKFSHSIIMRELLILPNSCPAVRAYHELRARATGRFWPRGRRLSGPSINPRSCQAWPYAPGVAWRSCFGLSGSGPRLSRFGLPSVRDRGACITRLGHNNTGFGCAIVFLCPTAGATYLFRCRCPSLRPFFNYLIVRPLSCWPGGG